MQGSTTSMSFPRGIEGLPNYHKEEKKLGLFSKEIKAHKFVKKTLKTYEKVTQKERKITLEHLNETQEKVVSTAMSSLQHHDKVWKSMDVGEKMHRSIEENTSLLYPIGQNLRVILLKLESHLIDELKHTTDYSKFIYQTFLEIDLAPILIHL